MNDKPKYNPYIHHRRSIRLKGYDYSQAGLYFITICVHDRACLFGDVINGEMVLNEYGQVAYNEWLKTTEIRNNVIEITTNTSSATTNHINSFRNTL